MNVVVDSVLLVFWFLTEDTAIMVALLDLGNHCKPIAAVSITLDFCDPTL